ncbi:hypothetical protein CHS0354_031170 [Potamilus streckersoni]|uniref:Uncharacterized protein n=1 Tax=Potamilus streckersoni TaxID=2493646 RepID=A0AAE0TKV2_9BIVA|nr:hypothetical protein CHS0354_031170 [Potamilus streckersoni]
MKANKTAECLAKLQEQSKSVKSLSLLKPVELSKSDIQTEDVITIYDLINEDSTRVNVENVTTTLTARLGNDYVVILGSFGEEIKTTKVTKFVKENKTFINRLLTKEAGYTGVEIDREIGAVLNHIISNKNFVHG